MADRISHVQSTLVLATESGDRKMMIHQVYLGLYQACYVSLDGSLVGRGKPTKHGWQWISDGTVSAKTLFKTYAKKSIKT